MKFLDRLELYKTRLLSEADEAPLPPGANAEENPTPQEAQATQEQQSQEQPEPEVQKLTAEGEVLLIRLLKKAFVVAPKPEDIEQMNDIGDINESNAREALSKIIALMKKYSTDIDLDVD